MRFCEKFDLPCLASGSRDFLYIHGCRAIRVGQTRNVIIVIPAVYLWCLHLQRIGHQVFAFRLLDLFDLKVADLNLVSGSYRSDLQNDF